MGCFWASSPGKAQKSCLIEPSLRSGWLGCLLTAWAGLCWGSRYPEEIGRHKDRKPRRDSQNTACVTNSLQRPGQGSGRGNRNDHVYMRTGKLLTLGCERHSGVTASALRGSSSKGSHADLECMTYFIW